MSLDDIRPAPASDLPNVNWGPAPADPPHLYATYEPEVAAATVQVLQQIRSEEPKITRAMIAAAHSSNARMPDELLAWRVKSPQSLADKVTKKKRIRPGMPSADIAGRLTDVVRYTAIVDHLDEIVGCASAMASELTGHGWQIVEAEQSYVEGNPYKGLHLLARTPSGQVIELQVHSVTSQAIKDQHHSDYETERDDSKPRAERAAARQRMVEAWATIRAPACLDGLVLGGFTVARKAYPNPY